MGLARRQYALRKSQRRSRVEIHEKLEGLGYLAPFPGSKQLRDTASGVRVEFLVTGDFPGDGKPKPVAFPDPAFASIEVDGMQVLTLLKLIELKLASGMSGSGRLKDLGDVQQLIAVLALPVEFANQLDPFVRPKYVELWTGVHDQPTL